MSELKICRICLRTEAKVYKYDQYQLKSYYEEILAQSIHEPDELPHYFCFECSTMLHKFHKFKEKCFFGQKILKEMLWKGPDGIIELLKLSQELKSNHEMLNTRSTSTTEQQSELFENPFIDKDIETSKPLALSLSGTDTLEIDSFFIQSHDVDLSVEENTKENQVLTNICPKTTNNISDSNYLLTESDSGYVVDSDLIEDSGVDLNLEESLENGSTSIFCEVPNEIQTFMPSDLEFAKMDLHPIENDNPEIHENSAMCDQRSTVVQESECTENNIEPLDCNVETNIKDTEVPVSSMIYCQVPDSSNLSISPNIMSCENPTESETPTIIYCDASNVENNLNLQTDDNQSLPIIYYDVSDGCQKFNKPVIGYLVTGLDMTSNNNVAFVDNGELANKKVVKINNCKVLSTSTFDDNVTINKGISDNHNSDKLNTLIENESTLLDELSISPGVLETNEFSENGASITQSVCNDNMESTTGSQSKVLLPCKSSSSETLIERALKKSNLFPIKNYDIDKVKIVTKNQVAPNIHSVLPSSSQEYFECDHEPVVDNVDSQDTLNRLPVKCGTEIEEVKKKRIRDRRKYPFNKRVKPNPCHKKCQNRCSTRMTEVERSIIHENYWKMDKRHQQEWLLSCIKPKKIRRRQGVSIIKNISYDYILNQGGKNVRVCQQFLMKTLDISQMRIRYAITKLGTPKDNKNDDQSEESDSSTSTCSEELPSDSSD